MEPLAHTGLYFTYRTNYITGLTTLQNKYSPGTLHEQQENLCEDWPKNAETDVGNRVKRDL